MKLFKLSALVLVAGIIFSGCSKNTKKQLRKPSANIDSTKWIDNLTDGKAAAVKENKKIFLFFSGDDQDGSSKGLKEAVFNTPEFMESMTKKYVLVNLDFSNSLFDAAEPKPDASAEEKKACVDLALKLDENMRNASVYNLQATPTFFILTKEGYVALELIFSKKPENLDDFNVVMEEKAEALATFDNVLTSARTGKTEDRLAAINRLFEMTDPQHRYVLADFCKDYIKLDKKNKTGMVGSFVVALCNSNALEYFLDNDQYGASQQYVKAAENKYLTAEDKQQCYYTAGLLYSMSEEPDYPVVLEYLHKAYDVAPESKDAEAVKSMIRMIDERFAETPAEAPAEAPAAE